MQRVGKHKPYFPETSNDAIDCRLKKAFPTPQDCWKKILAISALVALPPLPSSPSTFATFVSTVPQNMSTRAYRNTRHSPVSSILEPSPSYDHPDGDCVAAFARLSRPFLGVEAVSAGTCFAPPMMMLREENPSHCYSLHLMLQSPFAKLDSTTLPSITASHFLLASV